MIPHDERAEVALVGGLLVGYSDAINHVSERLCSSDFHVPRCGAVYDAIIRLWRGGDKVDLVAVADELRRRGEEIDHRVLVEMQAAGTSGYRKATDIVLRHALARRLIEAADAMRETAADVTRDPAETLDQCRALLSAIDLPVGALPADLYDSDQITGMANQKPAEWVVPGLLREGWRSLIVGFEGKGKSVLLTQCAVLASCGVHPLTGRDMPAVPTLIVDLENPSDVLAQRVRSMLSGREQQMTGWVWHRPAGVNVRRRNDRSELEAVIAHVRPKLVCIGPLYKLYRAETRESDESAALEVQAVLDDLRTRYGFALLLEHHAPHAEAGAKRKPRPYGSSLWLRWPEFGIGLEDGETPGSLELKRFRGDRVAASWPDRIDRGSEDRPWIGHWKRGF